MKGKKHEFSEYTRLGHALELVFSEVEKTSRERVSFDEAYQRVLAEDVKAKINVPPFDRAAMDGFAVRAEDTFGAEENDPNELKVVGSIEIGSESRIEVGAKEAAEISTGTPIPKNADAVVKVEETYWDGESGIKVISPVSPGKNVSSKGEDVEMGKKLFETGRLLRSSDIGILASSGNLEVEVRKSPKVGVSATGNELRQPGDKIRPSEIPEINTYTLDPAIRSSGGLPTRLGIVPDEVKRIKKTLNRSSDFDMGIFTGGTSVGKKDIVPDVIAEVGDLIFHGVAMRPGGPIGFGTVNETPVFSLPGFPAAALLSFEMVVKPALRKMQGLTAEGYQTEVKAELDRKISSSLGRLDIVRTKLTKKDGKYHANPIRVTGSSLLTSVSKADGLIIVPENKEGFLDGEEVSVQILEDL